MRFVKLLLAIPTGAALVVFAHANRDAVTIQFDPVGTLGLPPVAAPLYVAIFLAAGIGVVAGGAATWVGQSRYRRAARDAQAETVRLRADLLAAQSPSSLRGPK